MKRSLIHPIGRAVLAGAAPAVLIALVILVMTTPHSSAAASFASPLPTPPPQPRKATLPDISVVIAKSGGSLASTDGQVAVAFPSGVIKEPMTATLSFNVP